jgi:hypothetical protein
MSPILPCPVSSPSSTVRDPLEHIALVVTFSALQRRRHAGA